MAILDEDVARVREATDLVALVGEHLALKRSGRRFVGLCPFHQEKTPSFSVNPELGLFKCFGCGVSGDAITFVREIEHLDFVEAVERLAARAGITLRYDDRRASEARWRKSRLAETVGAAIDFYHELLCSSDEAKGARGYLHSRGFDGDAARRFLLGWAPADWDRLSHHLQQRGFARNDIVDAGLAFVNRANKLQDQFRARLMFPIYDSKGDPAGFGARALGNEGPKYKNSPETPLYRKSSLLYGLNWAKAHIVERGEVVICEGYTDVMACALAGAPHAVATCGTALTDEHVRVLKNLARRVVLAYDADAAGQGAAEQWYQWEQQYEIELRVAYLPAGRDPADVWRDAPGALLDALSNAAPFLQFRLDRLLASADLSTFEGRGRAGERAAALVAEHPNELVRDQYVMQLAPVLQIEPDVLRAAIARARGRGGHRGGTRRMPPLKSRKPVPAASRGTASLLPAERSVLTLCVNEPELVPPFLYEAAFVTDLGRTTFSLLASSDTLDDALGRAPTEVRDLLVELATEPFFLDDDDELTARQISGGDAAPNPYVAEARRALANARRHFADRTQRRAWAAQSVVIELVLLHAGRVLQALATANDPRATELHRLKEAVETAQDRRDPRATDLAAHLVGWLEFVVTTEVPSAPPTN